MPVSFEECLFEGDGSFAPVPFGDPRTIGFWKHQARVATGGRGKAHVDAAVLEGWLPLEVFDLEVTTLDELYDALWLKKAPMQQRAQQQCLASLLNLQYGQVGWLTDVGGQAFWELWADAGDLYDDGDFEDAKTLCDDFNNL